LESLSDFIATYVAVLPPLLGLLVSLVPGLAAGKKRWALVALFFLLTVLVAWASHTENQKLEASITGGDNVAFITVDMLTPKSPDGHVPLLMVNKGSGPVYDVRYWIYPGPTVANRNEARYWDLKLGGGFPWVNPGAEYATSQSLPPGPYVVEVEARNGLAIEFLQIIATDNSYKPVIVIKRKGKPDYLPISEN
jgi:hypothetical protein